MKIWIVILALFAAACSKGDSQHSPDDSYVASENAISFISEDNWEGAVTKGSNIVTNGFEDGNSIGVFAFFLYNGVWVPENEAPSFMYNQAVTLDTDTGEDIWNYNPPKYWPNATEDRIKFFSYFPHSINRGDNGIELSEIDDKGYPTIAFTPDAEVNKQIDFLTTTTGLLHKSLLTDGVVSLQYDHQLTQIKFSAKVDGPKESVTNVQVTGISYVINGVNSCLGRYTVDGFEWDLVNATNTSKTYTIGGTDQLKQNLTLNKTTYTELITDAGTMMLIPQELENEDIIVTINYSVINSLGETLTFSREIKAPKHELLKGRRMVYQFTIDLEDNYYIRLDAVSDEKWNDKEIELELDEMYFNLTGNTRAYNWVDHTTDTERLTIGIEYETNLPTTAIAVEKVAATTDGELVLNTDKSMIFYTRDNITEILTDRIKITLTFGTVTRTLYVDIEKKDMIIEFTVTVEPWDDEILDVEDLIIKFDVEVEEWENVTGDGIYDGIIDVE